MGNRRAMSGYKGKATQKYSEDMAPIIPGILGRRTGNNSTLLKSIWKYAKKNDLVEKGTRMPPSTPTSFSRSCSERTRFDLFRTSVSSSRMVTSSQLNLIISSVQLYLCKM